MGHGVKKCPEPIKEEANGGGGGWGNEAAAPTQGNWGDDSAAPAKGGWDQDETNNKASGDWDGDAGAAADTNDFNNGGEENGGDQGWNGDTQGEPQTTW
jgi:hypothetical protein